MFIWLKYTDIFDTLFIVFVDCDWSEHQPEVNLVPACVADETIYKKYHSLYVLSL